MASSFYFFDSVLRQMTMLRPFTLQNWDYTVICFLHSVFTFVTLSMSSFIFRSRLF